MLWKMMSQTTFNLFIIDNESKLLDLEDYDDVYNDLLHRNGKWKTTDGSPDIDLTAFFLHT